jgi:integrase
LPFEVAQELRREVTMAKQKRVLGFTEPRIKRLKPEPKRYDVHDTEVHALIVTVRPEGSKVYYLLKKIGGRTVRHRIAPVADLPVEEARRQAKILVGEVASGKNPAQVRAAARAESTLAAVWEQLTDEGGRWQTKRSLASDRRRWKLHLHTLAGRKMSAVTKADVNKLLTKITTSKKPYAANRVRALLHALFSEYINDGNEIPNPVHGTTINEETSRERALEHGELRRWWAAVLEEEPDVRHFLQLLLLSGVRCGTLTTARWEHIDLRDAVWHIPPESMKAGKPLDLPLAERTVKILQERAEAAAPGAVWVFPSTESRTGHLSRIPARGWRRVIRRAEIVGVRPHDLRRTFATYGHGVGVPINVLGKALGHTKHGGVTATYAKVKPQEVRWAVERTVSALLRIAESEDNGKVLDFGVRPAWAQEA